MFSSRWRISLVLLILASFILAGCGGAPATSTSTSQPAATTAATTAPSTVAATTAATTGATTAATAAATTAATTGATTAATTGATTAATAGATTAATTAATAGATTAAAAAGPTPKPTAPPPTLTPAPGAVTLQYWDMDWGFKQVLQDRVNEFNKQNPGIYVKFTQLEWGDYTQKLQGAIAAGTTPDVSGGDSGLPFNFDAQGQALPLDDLYAKFKSDGRFADLTQWGQDKWNYNGHYVGVSWQIDPRAIFYRKDLFQQAGIQPPTNHDELLAAAKKLNDPSKGISGICVPGKQGSYDTDQFYMTLVFQDGGGLADPQGKPTFDTPEQLTALKFEKELVSAAAPKGTPSYTFAEVGRFYEQGKCAMAFEGGWYIDQLHTDKPDMFNNTAILPVLKGQGAKATQRIVGFYNPWMVYKQSKHPAEAMKFVDFMMQKSSLKTIYDAVGGTKGSVYKSLRQDPVYQKNAMTKDFAEQVEKYAVDYWYPNNAAAIGIGAIGTGITDTIVNPVLTGSRSPEDALKDAQTKLGDIFQQKTP